MWKERYQSLKKGRKKTCSGIQDSKAKVLRINRKRDIKGVRDQPIGATERGSS